MDIISIKLSSSSSRRRGGRSSCRNLVPNARQGLNVQHFNPRRSTTTTSGTIIPIGHAPFSFCSTLCLCLALRLSQGL